MQLIGMLDSPYVRRVAISLQFLGLRFEHQPVSVFRHFAQFQQINPLVKAPTLVCDNGVVLMDSTLILDYAEALAGAEKSLMPAGINERQQALRVIGLALVAYEKSVQIAYEKNLRPADKQYQPWLDRVSGQLDAAYTALEQELQQHPQAASSQAGISAAVGWQFTRQMLPDFAAATKYPVIHALSEHAETLPQFIAAPYGNGTYHAAT